MSPWTPANNGHGKRTWFLARELNGSVAYHENRRGDLIRFKSFETAARAAARLNGWVVRADFELDPQDLEPQR